MSDKNFTCSGTAFEGAQIEVVLAKPPDKARTRFTRARNADTVKTTVSSNASTLPLRTSTYYNSICFYIL